MVALFLSFGSPATAGAQGGTDIYLFELSGSGTGISLQKMRNITARPGYDNQPSFTPDGKYVLYTSNRDGQTDIYRYNVQSSVTQRLTATAESEYSPTVVPPGDGFSVIQVEADSTQRLWKFRMDGSSATLLVPDVKPVGYHTWGDEHTVVMFVLGGPPTLQIMDLASGTREFVASDIGRSLHPVPGRHAVSFPWRDGNRMWIREVNLDDGGVRTLIEAVNGSQDYTWTPRGQILMGHGSELMLASPPGEWQRVADLKERGVTAITRLAISADGKWLAVVGADSGTP